MSTSLLRIHPLFYKGSIKSGLGVCFKNETHGRVELVQDENEDTSVRDEVF
jgi:hypothetical protein